MGLRQDIPELLKWIQDNQPRLDNSFDLVCIYEGDLLKFIIDMFKKEMGQQSLEQVLPRIPPINLLTKIVDKLSNIYQGSVIRYVDGGSDEDQELLDWYIDAFKMDSRWNQGNEFANLDKINLMQPFFNTATGMPDCRAVANNRFLPYSSNIVDPTIPTHMLTKMGTAKKEGNKKDEFYNVDIWWAYTDEEFIIFDSDGDIRLDMMATEGNPEGMNVYGKIPFTYVNYSQNFLLPPPDSDTKRMSVLIPALLSDLNYAAKFQSFSMIMAYNVNKENWTLAPNAIHFVSDDPAAQGQARVETIKPDVDITEVINLITSQLSMWLNSKGIKPGSIGQISADNMSGVSKIIDNMDTAEHRQKQATVYHESEAKFWDLVLNKMHPYWVSQGLVPNRHLLTQGAKVVTTFPEQTPFVSRKELVETLVLEMNNGFESQEGAIKRLNADMSDEEVEKFIGEINGKEEPPAMEVDDGSTESQNPFTQESE